MKIYYKLFLSLKFEKVPKIPFTTHVLSACLRLCQKNSRLILPFLFFKQTINFLSCLFISKMEEISYQYPNSTLQNKKLTECVLRKDYQMWN